jgi:hypothetical protein
MAGRLSATRLFGNEATRWQRQPFQSVSSPSPHLDQGQQQPHPRRSIGPGTPRSRGGLLSLAGAAILMGFITAEALYSGVYTTHTNVGRLP